MSSAKTVWPMHFEAASTLRNGFPITFMCFSKDSRQPVQWLRKSLDNPCTGTDCPLTLPQSEVETVAGFLPAALLRQAICRACNSHIERLRGLRTQPATDPADFPAPCLQWS